jgi:hypothetical protein
MICKRVTLPLLVIAGALSLSGCHETWYARQDAIRACRSSNDFVIAYRSGGTARAVDPLIRCMDAKGYYFTRIAPYCAKAEEPSISMVQCFRSKDRNRHFAETFDPQPIDRHSLFP